MGALESALAPPSGSDQLRKQLEGLKRDVNQCSLQLAHLHEERDKALVEMSRLEEVAPLVRKEQGANKRMVEPQAVTLHDFHYHYCLYYYYCYTTQLPSYTITTTIVLPLYA